MRLALLSPSRLPIAVLAVLIVVSPLKAGDLAQHQIIGFSPDGGHFAFEQYGVRDGSGFPYSEIFVIDTSRDAWVGGSPFKVLIQDETATVKAARSQAGALAHEAIASRDISEPGVTVAANPVTEVGPDPYVMIAYPRAILPQIGEPWTLRLEEIDLPRPDCAELGVSAKGFALSLERVGEPVRELHRDTRIPQSRNCTLSYAISEMLVHEADDGGMTLAVLVDVFSFGFEGPDRRFVAITARLD